MKSFATEMVGVNLPLLDLVLFDSYSRFDLLQLVKQLAIPYLMFIHARWPSCFTNILIFGEDQLSNSPVNFGWGAYMLDTQLKYKSRMTWYDPFLW